jgi:fatty-acyl-CoA synthase
LLQMLLHHPDSRSVDLRGWKVIVGGGPLTRGLARQAMERGLRIINGYGMSETCPVIALANLRPDLPDTDPERIVDIGTRTGFPLPLTHTRIVDEQGSTLPPGSAESGELVLQAPWLTTGYFKEPDRSQELWRSGWLHTGDVARLDADGYLRITDRLKDMIKIGGEWISSLELESALSQHPAVKESAVIALPDPKWDERPHALVVLHDAAQGKVTPKDLAAFLHTFVESGVLHKRAILTHIQLVDAIPRTSVGKPDKKLLRAQRRPPDTP